MNAYLIIALYYGILNGEIVQTFEGHLAAVRALAFTPDGSQLLSASDDTQIILWNVEDWRANSYL